MISATPSESSCRVNSEEGVTVPERRRGWVRLGHAGVLARAGLRRSWERVWNHRPSAALVAMMLFIVAVDASHDLAWGSSRHGEERVAVGVLFLAVACGGTWRFWRTRRYAYLWAWPFVAMSAVLFGLRGPSGWLSLLVWFMVALALRLRKPRWATGWAFVAYSFAVLFTVLAIDSDLSAHPAGFRLLALVLIGSTTLVAAAETTGQRTFPALFGTLVVAVAVAFAAGGLATDFASNEKGQLHCRDEESLSRILLCGAEASMLGYIEDVPLIVQGRPTRAIEVPAPGWITAAAGAIAMAGIYLALRRRNLRSEERELELDIAGIPPELQAAVLTGFNFAVDQARVASRTAVALADRGALDDVRVSLGVKGLAIDGRVPAIRRLIGSSRTPLLVEPKLLRSAMGRRWAYSIHHRRSSPALDAREASVELGATAEDAGRAIGLASVQFAVSRSRYTPEWLTWRFDGSDLDAYMNFRSAMSRDPEGRSHKARYLEALQIIRGANPVASDNGLVVTRWAITVLEAREHGYVTDFSEVTQAVSALLRMRDRAPQMTDIHIRLALVLMSVCRSADDTELNAGSFRSVVASPGIARLLRSADGMDSLGMWDPYNSGDPLEDQISARLLDDNLEPVQVRAALALAAGKAVRVGRAMLTRPALCIRLLTPCRRPDAAELLVRKDLLRRVRWRSESLGLLADAQYLKFAKFAGQRSLPLLRGLATGIPVGPNGGYRTAANLLAFWSLYAELVGDHLYAAKQTRLLVAAYPALLASPTLLVNDGVRTWFKTEVDPGHWPQ